MLSALSYSNPDIGTISNALNDISALGYLLGDIFGFSQSGNSLAAKVKTTAGQLGTQLKTLYANDQIALGRAAGIILTDYGKLTAAGNSPSFQTSLSELSTVGPEITIGASRFIYNHLLPAAYRPYAVLQTGINPPYFNHRGQPSVNAHAGVVHLYVRKQSARLQHAVVQCPGRWLDAALALGCARPPRAGPSPGNRAPPGRPPRADARARQPRQSSRRSRRRSS